jgi:hypothetical protein
MTTYLLDQGYGECELLPGWVSVQADDTSLIASVLTGDAEDADGEAARQAARDLGTTCAYFPGLPANEELELSEGHGDWAVYIPRHIERALGAVSDVTLT